MLNTGYTFILMHIPLNGQTIKHKVILYLSINNLDILKLKLPEKSRACYIFNALKHSTLALPPESNPESVFSARGVTLPRESGEAGRGMLASLFSSLPVPRFLVPSNSSSSPVSRTTLGSESVLRTETRREVAKKSS